MHAAIRSGSLFCAALAIVSVVTTATALADDRAAMVSLGGGITVSETDDFHDEGAGTGRLALSWELPRLALPAQPGYNVDVTLVPELLGGTLHSEDRMEMMLGAGVRGELRMAQREMGLFKVSARAGFYVAARGAVIGKDRDPFLEAVLGEHFYLGLNTSVRLAFECGYFERRHNMSIAEDGSAGTVRGLIAQISLGFGL